ncbi:FtsW/RodA/SpoVE family cell cycle protein [Metabacillus malikii]|uniref:Cell division protein FtsW (Lipid II flippase) n=1 Tax=Metabacillus malikii TaxID=1504265 RepID=A0ABT9ZJ27_9BACI|nr:FtsW/RodA/SpoVE family cell cycle protein [Metabacillus malikii]MDQ0232262.1 cell division protein FtsW (lipid II flippase) [Metabacillus malikii]
MSNQKEHFLAEVLQYIKSKEAKEAVYKELNYHLKMSKLELVSKGTPENEAEERSIKQMGSPTELGTHFNRLYRPKFDWKLFGLFFIIILMGILPTLNGQEPYFDDSYLKQTIYIVLGIVVAISVMLLDYRKLKRFGWLYLVAAISILLALHFITDMPIKGAAFIEINGVPYLNILGFNFSGSSLFPLFLLFWASYLSKEKPKIIVIICVYLISVLLFFALPNFSEALIYSALVFSLFCSQQTTKKVSYKRIGASLGLIATVVCIFWFTVEDYQRIRLLGYLNPDDYPENEGYMYVLLKKIISEGGWFGNNENTIGALTHDMAFANITYYYGWVLSGFLFTLLVLLLYRLIVISTQIKDRFGKQLILGVCALLAAQFVYNIGMTFGIFPIISMSLPFISYGLISTVFNSFLIGIVLSVYRRKDLVINI